MPRWLLGVFMLLLALPLFVRAQGDVVLLSVGSERITKQEFEYHFNRSQEKRADIFVEMYGRFKQKVLYAKELRLDTMVSYRRQRDLYAQLMKQRASSGNSRDLNWNKEKEWMQLMCVTYPLKQSANEQNLVEGNRYMDSLYTVLKDGVGVRQMEVLPWIQSRHLLNEWQKQLDGLAKYEISKPFVSPIGIHIIGWKEKRMGIPMGGKTSKLDEDLDVKEMEEALLVAVLDGYWEKWLVCTEEDLKEHFKKNRSDYGFGTPHFKGAVIHCHDKKEAKAIKKYLKKYPVELWEAAIERMPRKVSEGCRMEVGLFAVGVNQYVDKLVFKCGSFEPLKDYPYTWVLGRILKKGPEDFQTIRKKVEYDCRESKKKAETEALMRKFKIEINKEILKTVNRADF